MSAFMSTERRAASEQHRHECECRYWLEDTKGAEVNIFDIIEEQDGLVG